MFLISWLKPIGYVTPVYLVRVRVIAAYTYKCVLFIVNTLAGIVIPSTTQLALDPLLSTYIITKTCSTMVGLSQ